jgi:transcriptional regulator with XRE-family HTH domain
LANNKLGDFIRQVCKERGLSLRSLSINAGLSPGTVNGLLNRQYQPSIFSLNQLADYLGVKRQYLWHLAGLLKDMDYSEDTVFSDPRLRFHLAQADKLPELARTLIVDVVKAVNGCFQPPKNKDE